jgi:hypothetical protein
VREAERLEQRAVGRDDAAGGDGQAEADLLLQVEPGVAAVVGSVVLAGQVVLREVGRTGLSASYPPGPERYVVWCPRESRTTGSR